MAVAVSASTDINSIQTKDQAADPAAPAAGYVQLYSKAGVLYGRKSDGTVTALANPGGANPTAAASAAAVNGSAATFMRSDGAPAINMASMVLFTQVFS